MPIMISKRFHLYSAVILICIKDGCMSGSSRAKEEVMCNKNISLSEHLCLPRDYNKFDLPYPSQVNIIDIGIDIVDVLRINDKEYSVEFSSYFNVMWEEPRLYIPDAYLSYLNITDIHAMFPVNLELVNHLWLPNVFIYNLKTFKVVQVLSKHAGLWITRNHEVMYSQATHINFICPMRFDAFPLDTQTCKFQVGSYSYDLTKMAFKQTNKVQGFVKTANSVVLDYSVDIIQLGESDFILDYGELGNFSVAGFEMVLQRHVSHYLITYYLPSGLFVVVSWISFVVPPDVIPGRMALLITLFLVLVNIFNTVTTNTPKAEEYAVILFNKQKGKSVQRRPQHVKIVCKDKRKYELNSPDTGGTGGTVLPLDRPAQHKNLCGENYIVADRLFLILSPILFLIFNVIYWLTYCSDYIL